MKVIVLDDNAAIRASLKLVLKRVAEEVVCLGDPHLLPALLPHGDVDAVILDMNYDTADFDGHDGLFWIKRIKEEKNPPAVIAITAFGEVSLAVEAMKAGAEDFVTKPWDNDTLLRKLKVAVDRNRNERAGRKTVEDAEKAIRQQSERDSMTIDELRLDHVRRVVDNCGGNLSAAATKLGINRQTLYNILKKG